MEEVMIDECVIFFGWGLILFNASTLLEKSKA